MAAPKWLCKELAPSGLAIIASVGEFSHFGGHANCRVA